MSTVALPDVEGGCRTWLRSLSSVTALVSNRIWFALPDDVTDDDFPCVTVQRVGGSMPTEAPADHALLQITVIGPRRDKATTSAVERAVRAEIADLREPTVWSSTATCLGGTEESSIFTVDPLDSRPRYSITGTFVVVHPDY